MSSGEKVDGMLSHVAGGGAEFQSPLCPASRDAHPFMNFLYPTDIFPFTDVEQTDRNRPGRRPDETPETRIPAQGVLLQLVLRILGRAASLIHTTMDECTTPRSGTFDLPLRRFNMARPGFPRSIGQQLNNPTDFRWSMRALLTAMNRWSSEGVAPPPSRYPRIDNRTLVPPENLAFPSLPGVNYSSRPHKAYRADYGPEFRTKGIVTLEPPKIGSAFPMRVPAIDRDGNEIAGIKMPELAIPLATSTGWNLFNAASGPTNEISGMAGSYIPFLRTEAERAAKSDPRRSIAERYRSRDEYLGLVAQAALDLIGQGYLLRQDMSEIVKNAARHWDFRMRNTASQ